jgi:hypothetical protein
MNSELEVDLEGSDHHLIEVLSQNLPRGIEEDTNNFNQDIRHSGRDSKQALPSKNPEDYCYMNLLSGATLCAKLG